MPYSTSAAPSEARPPPVSLEHLDTGSGQSAKLKAGPRQFAQATDPGSEAVPVRAVPPLPRTLRATGRQRPEAEHALYRLLRLACRAEHAAGHEARRVVHRPQRGRIRTAVRDGR